MVINEAAIVTIRNSSTRLPEKAIKKIKDDLTSADIIIERAKKTKFPVILATSKNSEDDVFVKIAEKHQIEIFRGSFLNKIKRWYDCFRNYEIEFALLIDGDDLAYDYDIGHRAMRELKSSNVDLVVNPKNIVCGFFTYAITKNAISKLYSVAPSDSTNTDVITRYVELAKLEASDVNLKKHEQNQQFRLTLDYLEDLEFFRKLYKNIDILSNGKGIIRFLSNDKTISQINYHRQKDFLKNQAKFNESVK